jgi:hypothetical protein
LKILLARGLWNFGWGRREELEAVILVLQYRGWK